MAIKQQIELNAKCAWNQAQRKQWRKVWFHCKGIGRALKQIVGVNC